MQPARYPYGEEFQFKILALLVQDPTFLASYYDAINPAYFERVHLTTVAQLLLNHFTYYRCAPDYASLAAWVEDHVQRCNVPQQVADAIRQTVYWVFSNPVSDPDYVKDRVLRFGQRQALKGAVNDILDKLERDDDYEDCRSIVERALEVGLQKDAGLDVGASMLSLPAMAAASHTYSRRVPTNLSTLDMCLSGGLGAGELGVIVAAPGVGKSTTLTNFGYGAWYRGFRVLHVTMELKEIDIALKYAARHTGRPMDQIVRNDPSFQQLVQMAPFAENTLKVKYFSPGTATSSNVRALMSYLRGQGFYPDLLIVDYLKKMKYEGEIVGGLGRLCDDLISIGDDFRCGVWTAQQAQRNFRFKDKTDVNGIANDISVLENADVAIAISQTELEHREDRYRMELGKVRRGDDVHMIACWCQYANSTVQEMDEGAVAALYGVETSGGQ